MRLTVLVALLFALAVLPASASTRAEWRSFHLRAAGERCTAAFGKADGSCSSRFNELSFGSQHTLPAVVDYSWKVHGRTLVVSGNRVRLHATYDPHTGSCHVVSGEVFGVKVTGANAAHVGQQHGPLAMTIHADTLTLTGFLLG
jgi:hypothetical protein